MKKSIIFVVINMNVGGTEKALLNMINEFPINKYKITFFMLERYGDFQGHIPEGVNVKYFKDYANIKELLNEPPRLMFIKLIKERRILKALTVMGLHLLTKVLRDRSPFFYYCLKETPTIEEEYDVAVAYSGPMDFISYFVLKKIQAKKKVQWIHFDITKIGFNLKFASKYYGKFDKIFVVSNTAKFKFLKVLPKLQTKTDVMLNITSPTIIKKQSQNGQGFTDHFDGLRILTVGRISAEKGPDLAISVLARLIEEGYKVRWYCVGDGNFKDRCQKLIRKYNLEEHFLLLGSHSNPYPFMKQCDIYVQPSRHEGYCITLAEARSLNKPIVTTFFI